MFKRLISCGDTQAGPESMVVHKLANNNKIIAFGVYFEGAIDMISFHDNGTFDTITKNVFRKLFFILINLKCLFNLI